MEGALQHREAVRFLHYAHIQFKVLLTDPHAPGRSLCAQIACMAHARLRRQALYVAAKAVASHASLQALSLDSKGGSHRPDVCLAGLAIAARCVAERAGCIKQAKKEGTFVICDPKPRQVPQDRCL